MTDTKLDRESDKGRQTNRRKRDTERDRRWRKERVTDTKLDRESDKGRQTNRRKRDIERDRRWRKERVTDTKLDRESHKEGEMTIYSFQFSLARSLST